jgi:hypothetical protein
VRDGRKRFWNRQLLEERARERRRLPRGGGYRPLVLDALEAVCLALEHATNFVNDGFERAARIRRTACEFRNLRQFAR